MRVPVLCVVAAARLCLAVGPAAVAQNPPAPPAVAPTAQPAAERVIVEIDADGVSVAAAGVDAHEFFNRYARKTGLQIMIDDTVKRTITVNLTHRKAGDILDTVVSAYGLACRQVKGIFMISEGIPKTPSSYLLSDIDSISTQYVLAPNAKSLLPVFLQDHVKTNPEQNSVILSAPPDVLRKFREDIRQFDIPASQIMIDVLMVEFTDSGAREFSLKWDWTNATRQVSVDTPAGSLFYRTLVTLPDAFSAGLKSLVTQGKARVKANPRIATVSGQKAGIFIGKQRYLSTPVAITGGSDGSMIQTNSIDAGVRLDMTPFTGGEGEIIIDIHPEISVLSALDPKTGLPDRSTRRANTTVRVRDGETVILGGLTQQETISTRTRMPILGDLPLLGPLFRSTDSKESSTEMAIFITPRILSTTGHLPAEEEKKLRERFLQGDAPKGKAP
jgi:type IV pilus assembly protein PilQ